VSGPGIDQELNGAADIDVKVEATLVPDGRPQ
jgi:hypothetical protein